MSRASCIAVIVITLASAGCGGSDEPAAGPTPATVASTTTSSPAEPATATVTAEATTAPEAETVTTATTAADATEETEEPSDAPKPAGGSRAGFTRSADGICRDAREQIGRRGRLIQHVIDDLARRKIDEREYYRRTADLTEESAVIASRAVALLRRLDRPHSGRSALEAYLDGSADQSRLLSALADALRAANVEETKDLNRRMLSNGARTSKAARRFGFRTCGGG